jgi:hypothetical protein
VAHLVPCNAVAYFDPALFTFHTLQEAPGLGPTSLDELYNFLGDLCFLMSSGLGIPRLIEIDDLVETLISSVALIRFASSE